MILYFDHASFVQRFPAFSDIQAFPQATLQFNWDTSATFINSNTAVCGLTAAQRVLALNLMTAHFTELNELARKGEQGGVLTSAGIDRVNVSVQPPPEVNQWQWWLNQTSYGQQLLALYQIAAAGGFFIGGYPSKLQR